MKTRNRYLILAMVMIFGTVLSIQAQPRGGRGPGGGYGYPDSCRIQLMVDDLRQEIGLNDQQVKNIEAIHFAHIAEVKAIRSEYRNDCVGARQAHWDLRAKVDGEVKALLNAEQGKKYDAFMAERRGPHGRGPGCKG